MQWLWGVCHSASRCTKGASFAAGSKAMRVSQDCCMLVHWSRTKHCSCCCRRIWRVPAAGSFVCWWLCLVPWVCHSHLCVHVSHFVFYTTHAYHLGWVLGSGTAHCAPLAGVGVVWQRWLLPMLVLYSTCIIIDMQRLPAVCLLWATACCRHTVCILE